jgi:hypothetical protein
MEKICRLGLPTAVHKAHYHLEEEARKIVDRSNGGGRLEGIMVPAPNRMLAEIDFLAPSGRIPRSLVRVTPDARQSSTGSSRWRSQVERPRGKCNTVIAFGVGLDFSR